MFRLVNNNIIHSTARFAQTVTQASIRQLHLNGNQQPSRITMLFKKMAASVVIGSAAWAAYKVVNLSAVEVRNYYYKQFHQVLKSIDQNERIDFILAMPRWKISYCITSLFDLIHLFELLPKDKKTTEEFLHYLGSDFIKNIITTEMKENGGYVYHQNFRDFDASVPTILNILICYCPAKGHLCLYQLLGREFLENLFTIHDKSDSIPKKSNGALYCLEYMEPSDRLPFIKYMGSDQFFQLQYTGHTLKKFIELISVESRSEFLIEISKPISFLSQALHNIDQDFFKSILREVLALFPNPSDKQIILKDINSDMLTNYFINNPNCLGEFFLTLKTLSSSVDNQLLLINKLADQFFYRKYIDSSFFQAEFINILMLSQSAELEWEVVKQILNKMNDYIKIELVKNTFNVRNFLRLAFQADFRYYAELQEYVTNLVPKTEINHRLPVPPEKLSFPIYMDDRTAVHYLKYFALIETSTNNPLCSSLILLYGSEIQNAIFAYEVESLALEGFPDMSYGFFSPSNVSRRVQMADRRHALMEACSEELKTCLDRNSRRKSA